MSHKPPKSVSPTYRAGNRDAGSCDGCVLFYWALEYHTLILFFLKEPLINKSLYFFLPGQLEAQSSVGSARVSFLRVLHCMEEAFGLH